MIKRGKNTKFQISVRTVPFYIDEMGKLMFILGKSTTYNEWTIFGGMCEECTDIWENETLMRRLRNESINHISKSAADVALFEHNGIRTALKRELCEESRGSIRFNDLQYISIPFIYGCDAKHASDTWIYNIVFFAEYIGNVASIEKWFYDPRLNDILDLFPYRNRKAFEEINMIKVFEASKVINMMQYAMTKYDKMGKNAYRNLDDIDCFDGSCIRGFMELFVAKDSYHLMALIGQFITIATSRAAQHISI